MPRSKPERVIATLPLTHSELVQLHEAMDEQISALKSDLYSEENFEQNPDRTTIKEFKANLAACEALVSKLRVTTQNERSISTAKSAH